MAAEPVYICVKCKKVVPQSSVRFAEGETPGMEKRPRCDQDHELWSRFWGPTKVRSLAKGFVPAFLLAFVWMMVIPLIPFAWTNAPTLAPRLVFALAGAAVLIVVSGLTLTHANKWTKAGDPVSLLADYPKGLAIGMLAAIFLWTVVVRFMLL
jgi:hypothetical protein